MKLLLAFAGLALCTNVMAQTVVAGGASIVSRDGSTVSAGPGGASITSRNGDSVSAGRAGSVILDNQGSVTSSVTTDGTGTTSSSIVGRTGSMCSAENAGRRCEVSCQAPQVAQCAKGERAGEPLCYCN